MREGKSLSDLNELKEAKERLEEDSFLFLEVFEKAHEGMCLFGASGRLYFLNDSYASLLGYIKEELMDPSFSRDALIFPEDLGLVHNNVAEVKKTGQPRHYEARFLKKDGSVIRVMVSESKLEGRMGERPEEVMLETIYDITELRKTQHQLEQTVANQERTIEEATERIEHECRYWREVFESSQSGMAVFDPDGRVWDVNEALASMLGYTKEEVLSPDFSWARLIVKEELSMATTHLQELLEAGVSQSLERTFIHKDGHKVPTVISYTKLTKRPDWSSERMVANIQDITGIKVQQDYVNDLLKLLPIGMFSFDLETARIYSASPLLQDMLGYSKEELTQKVTFDLLPEEVHGQARELIQKTLQTGEKSWVRWPLFRKDGARLSAMIAYGKVFDPCIQKDTMAVFVVDVSESEQAKARMELLLKLSPVGVVEWREGGELLGFNDRYAEIAGYTKEELTRLGWLNITPTEYKEMEDEQIRRLLTESDRVTYRKEYCKKDGSRVPVMLTTQNIRNENGSIDRFISYVQDLTPIVEKERFLDRVLNTLPDGVCIGDSSGRLYLVNEAYAALYGRSKEELLENGWLSVTAEEEIAKTKNHLEAIQTKASAKEAFEKKYVAPDGTIRYAHVIYVPVHFMDRDAVLCSFQDITELKEAQQKAERLHAFSQDIVGRSVNGIVAISPDGTIRMANDAAKRLLRLSQDNAGSILDRIEPEKRIEHQKWIADILSKGHGTCHGHETTLKSADGSELNVLLFHELSRFPEDDTPCVLLFFTDITPLKEAQEKLQEVVEAQQRTIKELSTPVIPVWSRVLMAPMMGSFDSQRMHDLSERLLEETARQKPRAVLLDLSGLAYVDTQVISEVVQLIASVRILGTRTVLSGINPHTAQSLVRLGAKLEGVPTYATLDQALKSVAGGAGNGKS